MNETIWNYRDQYAWIDKVENEDFPPMMINCSLTPLFWGKEYNENIPETISEQVESACEAFHEGASIIHINGRNPAHQSEIATSASVYSEINKKIRERCPGVVVTNSTWGEEQYTIEEKMVSLDAEYKPDMAGLNTGIFQLNLSLKERKEHLSDPKPARQLLSSIPLRYCDVNYLAKKMKSRGIKPMIEIYHQGHYWIFNDLIMKDRLETPYVCKLIFGMQSFNYASPQKLLNTINELPPDIIYFVAGMGSCQLPMNAMSVILGGHVTVGLADNVNFSKNKLAKSNGQLVARIRNIAEKMNRKIATPQQTREMLRL